MPYIVETVEGKEAAEKAASLFPDLDPRKIEKLELEGSSFSDPGEDWTCWRAYAPDGSILARSWSAGY